MKENTPIDKQPLRLESWASKLFPKEDDDFEYDLAIEFYNREDEDEEGDEDWLPDEMEGVEKKESK